MPPRWYPYSLTKKLFLTISNLWNLFTLSLILQFNFKYQIWKLKKFLNGLIRIHIFRKSTNHQWNSTNGTPLEKKVASVFLKPSSILVSLHHSTTLGNNNWLTLLKPLSWLFVMSRFTVLISGINSNLVSMNYLEEEQEKLKIGCTTFYTLFENVKKVIPKAFMMVLDGLEEGNIPTPTKPSWNWDKIHSPDSALTCQPYRYERISTGTSNHDFFSQVGTIST